MDAKPWKSDFTKRPEGIAPIIDPFPDTILQNIDGNIIDSGKSNGSVFPSVTLAILWRKNF